MSTSIPTFSTEYPLRAHQREAVDKLKRSRVGALFMDMRTGKTRTAMELIRPRLINGKVSRVLWFCPTEAKSDIRDDILKHLPGSSVHVFDDQTRAGSIPSATWYIVGLEGLSSSARIYDACLHLSQRAFLVIDEAGLVSNRHAKRTRRIYTIRGDESGYRLILDGTPIGNGVEDLYAPITWLSWKILGYTSWRDFARRHLSFSDDPGRRRRITGRHNVATVTAKIAPYVYQVRRHDCFDLPAETWNTVSFNMTPEQRRLYERAKSEILYGPDAFEWSDTTIYRLFNALQQIVSGFWNRTWKDDKGVEHVEHIRLFDNVLDNPRANYLRYLIDSVPKDHQGVVWTKYRLDSDVASAVAEKALGAGSFFLYDGRTPASEREDIKRRFRAGERPWLIANQAVASRAIDLSCASYSIYYASTFKARERRQSEARIHGPAQTRPVSYTDIVCENSIDSKIIMPCLGRKEDAWTSFRSMLHEVKEERSRSKKKGERMLNELMRRI